MNIFKVAVTAAFVYSSMLCMYMGYETYVAVLQGDSYGTIIGSMMTTGCKAVAVILFILLRAGACDA